ncbi:hypothetical protein PR048_001442 [Dryococelus australis]|uniref:Uncharacterized protein n=1 Tax=Dryococelus australis TaxID=614101 RepID=A0ABQ9IHC9_9NEOP|nr:hypothetical protein PR048_001442 [Dryococelus australis]
MQAGGKMSVNKGEWKQESKKQARNSGRGYISTSGISIDAQTFAFVDTCCVKKCSNAIPHTKQKDLFDNFWHSCNKEVQDVFLSRCMTQATVKTMGRILMDLFQISMKRMRLIQEKVLKNSTFEEKRGTHANRSAKLDGSVWDMMLEHLKTKQHKKSHYCEGKLQLLHFDDPTLDIKTLHGMFYKYFKEKIGKQLTMKYKTYFKFFLQKCGFSFHRPKTDCCDFCLECGHKLQ